eukprot:15433700-Alexandrium_andersonii.AAC.1
MSDSIPGPLQLDPSGIPRAPPAHTQQFHIGTPDFQERASAAATAEAILREAGITSGTDDEDGIEPE